MVTDKEVITSKTLARINSKPSGYETIFFFGRITYQTLNETHHTEFCAYLMPFETSTLPDTDATKGTKVDRHFVLRQCSRWHNSD
jgi:hypothetical protein